MSDFRVVALRGRTAFAEVALHDIASIDVEPSTLERLTGIGTLVIASSRRGDQQLRVGGVFRARQTALHLNLLLADIRGLPPDDRVTSMPIPKFLRVPPNRRMQAALIGPAFVLLAAIVIVFNLRGHEKPVVYGPDDPIRPNGVKRSHAEIVGFMESEVMPFARKALEPIVGPGNVRCETCHGQSAEARHWAMPAVVALPEPAVRGVAPSAGSDSQMRNAMHGYLADEENQRKAGHMRQVVLPGMAALMRRPAYDFGRSYEYNRERAAFGCYHCHMVQQ